MSATVDALLPLSFLEAIRTVDTPEGEGAYEAEYVSELRNKRLGLSETVYAQIRRFNDLSRRSLRSSHDEAVSIARLLGRRPDAESVFRQAGRHIARESYLTIPAPTRRLVVALPALVARPVALRQVRRIAARYLNGVITRVGGSLLLDVSDSVTLDTAPRGAGCAYYESALRELLRLLIGGGGAVEHTRCRSRGDATCEWRAEWRAVRH
jgi:predicted hydrocarbon binding protein